MAPFPTSLPASRVPDPGTAPAVRWGILAPGGIADTFVTALATHTRQVVTAVGSRSADRAAAFAAKHGIARSYGSYEAMLADPEVEAVYIASPHSEHRDHAMAAIAAGKHVLVEKAFTRNATEAAEVVAAARAAGVTAMEAMWTRFLPQSDVVRQLLADGVLGDIAAVFADHGQYFAHLDPSHRLLNPELAGGALLDLGIYPVSFAASVLGSPDRVAASGSLTATGVDAQVSIALQSGPAQAHLHTTLLAQTPTTAAINGSAARIELSGPFYAPGVLSLTATGTDGARLIRDVDAIAAHHGLCYEACEFARCVTERRTESPLLPLDETVQIMQTMDEIRRQIGLVYPGE